MDEKTIDGLDGKWIVQISLRRYALCMEDKWWLKLLGALGIVGEQSYLQLSCYFFIPVFFGGIWMFKLCSKVKPALQWMHHLMVDMFRTSLKSNYYVTFMLFNWYLRKYKILAAYRTDYRLQLFNEFQWLRHNINNSLLLKLSTINLHWLVKY